MSRLVRFCFVVALGGSALLPASACGGSSGGSGVFLYQYCGALQHCCDVVGLPDDRTQCARRLGAEHATHIFDQGKADACLYELEEQRLQVGYCQSPLTFAPSCTAVFRAQTNRGTFTLGEACDLDADCASSSLGPVSCGEVDGARLCRLELVGVAGSAPCAASFVSGARQPRGHTHASTVYTCADRDGLFCDAGANDGPACAPRAASGSTCAQSDGCDEGLACDLVNDVCVTVAQLGEPCAAHPCVAGAFCDGGVCRVTLEPGAACTQNVMCASYRCHQLTCVEPEILVFCGGE